MPPPIDGAGTGAWATVAGGGGGGGGGAAALAGAGAGAARGAGRAASRKNVSAFSTRVYASQDQEASQKASHPAIELTRRAGATA